MRAWDDIAVQQDVLLEAEVVDRKAVKDTLLESNRLLGKSPDRTLRRLARLAKMPHDFDLEKKRGGIFASSTEKHPSMSAKQAASPAREAFSIGLKNTLKRPSK